MGSDTELGNVDRSVERYRGGWVHDIYVCGCTMRYMVRLEPTNGEHSHG